MALGAVAQNRTCLLTLLQTLAANFSSQEFAARIRWGTQLMTFVESLADPFQENRKKICFCTEGIIHSLSCLLIAMYCIVKLFNTVISA